MVVGRMVVEPGAQRPEVPRRRPLGRSRARHQGTDQADGFLDGTIRSAELGYHEHVCQFSAHRYVLNHHEDPRDLLDVHELGAKSAELAGKPALTGCDPVEGSAVTAVASLRRVGANDRSSPRWVSKYHPE